MLACSSVHLRLTIVSASALEQTNPNFGRMKLLARDEMAHADFVDRVLLAGFLGFALGLDFAQHLERLLVLAHQALFIDREREQRVFRAAQRFGEHEGGLRLPDD